MKTRMLFVAGLLGAGVILGPRQAMAAERNEMTAVADSVYDVVDEVAHFKGGDAAMWEYVAKTMRYPEAMRKQGKSGRVFVTFEVSKKGVIQNPVIKQTPDEGFNEEVLRVVKSMPKWIPAKYHGKKVAMRITLPVMFRL